MRVGDKIESFKVFPCSFSSSESLEFCSMVYQLLLLILLLVNVWSSSKVSLNYVGSSDVIPLVYLMYVVVGNQYSSSCL